jgi:hypothetical protein
MRWMGRPTVKRPNETVPTNFRRETPLAAMVVIVVADYSDGFALALREGTMAQKVDGRWGGSLRDLGWRGSANGWADGPRGGLGGGS